MNDWHNFDDKLPKDQQHIVYQALGMDEPMQAIFIYKRHIPLLETEYGNCFLPPYAKWKSFAYADPWRQAIHECCNPQIEERILKKYEEIKGTASQKNSE